MPLFQIPMGNLVLYREFYLPNHVEDIEPFPFPTPNDNKITINKKYKCYDLKNS